MTELTHVEFEWVKGRIENWIRFGRSVRQRVVDSRRRFVSFALGSIVAYIRWAANGYGTILSRIDIPRAVGSGESFSKFAYVRLGGESLLHLSTWRKAEKMLQAIDAVEALGIDPADVVPDALAPRPQPFVRSVNSRDCIAGAGIRPGSEG